MIELCGDKIGIVEVQEGLDAHTDNQKKFNLPSRLIAKLFLYRCIYRGPAFAYAHDVEFGHVSKNVKFWENVIQAFYEKYHGIAEEQTRWINTVNRHGQMDNPLSGRIHIFKRVMKMGVLQYSDNDITNYPNQSFGAEIMACARVHICKELKRLGLYNTKVFPILTVHDSNIFDCVNEEDIIVTLVEIIRDTMFAIREIWGEIYGTPLEVPHDCEIKVGRTWADLDTVYKDGNTELNVVRNILKT